MTNAGDPTVERIKQLTREELLEAVLALQADLPPDAAPETDEARTFLAGVEESPYRNIEDVEELARAVLVAASLDAEMGPKVDEIMDSVGKRAFIFGGAEIIGAAALAVVALQVILSRGKKSEEETVEVETDKEGRVVIRKHRRVVYGISGKAAALVSAVLGGR